MVGSRVRLIAAAAITVGCLLKDVEKLVVWKVGLKLDVCMGTRGRK